MTRISQLQGPHKVPVTFPASASASSTEDVSVWVAPFNCVVTGVELVPDAAVTANATNFATLSVKVGSTVAASRSWAATNSVAYTKENATLSATLANRNLTAGDVVRLARTVDASGVATPRMTVVLSVQIR